MSEDRLEHVASGLFIYAVQRSVYSQELYDAINAACEYVGLKARVFGDLQSAKWEGDDFPEAEKMMLQIRSIGRYSWESEISQIKQILIDCRRVHSGIPSLRDFSRFLNEVTAIALVLALLFFIVF